MKISFRVWVLIVALLLASLAVSPWKALEKGVLITSVEANSTAFEQGLKSGQIIIAIDGNPINNIDDFSKLIQGKFPSTEKIKTTIITKDNEFVLFSSNAPEITVSSIPKSKIKTGLDLSGGSKALIKAKDKQLTSAELSDLISITSNRLNTYGISDVKVVPVKDLSGNNYMSIEIAGATPKDLEDLISKQGKFEAKIGNETLFIGGERDITSVCRNDATCAGIKSCDETQDGAYCSFTFVIYLSEQAAQRHAEITADLLSNVTSGGKKYLSKPLDLYLDDILVDSLLISEDLKGRKTTEIQIQGSGTGADKQEAYKDATNSMHKLQIILITGSLPYKLEIVKLDTISPSLGKEFLRNIIILGLLVFAIISIVLFMKYRKIKITLSVIMTMFSEAFITLGIAAFINWNLDAPSIAGIIAGMGTGVNDQIVIIDESVSNTNLGIKERIKRAFFIILGAFFTIIAAMLPLFWAGAGMLKGFALTTIIGVSVGILITRPAFADIIKKIQG
ncbi:MAG: PDZ domain-containing protein [Nanoarchaeota archaeon]